MNFEELLPVLVPTMKYCVIFSTFFILVSAKAEKTNENAANCPSNLPKDKYLQSFGDKCYRFELNRKDTFPGARRNCQSQGGHLAFIKSEDINNFIQKELTQTYSLTDSPVWIGLSYSASDRKFHWDDGSVADYKHFRSHTYGFIQALSNLCTGIIPNSGLWNNYVCMTPFGLFEIKNAFICEFKTIPVTTARPTKPSTTASQSVTKLPTKRPTIRLPTTPPKLSSTKDPDTLLDKLCPPGLKRDQYLKIYKDTCYRFEVNSKAYFDEAEKTCEQDGGTLAIVKSDQTNNFLLNQLRSTFGVHNKAFWIGLYYDTKNGRFEWQDGSNLLYVHFGQSSFFTPFDCVGLNASNGMWDMYKCVDQLKGEDTRKNFVCQYQNSLKTSTTPMIPIRVTRPSIETSTTATTASSPESTHEYVTTIDNIHVGGCLSMIACTLDCGMKGYQINPKTRCFICKCNTT